MDTLADIFDIYPTRSTLSKRMVDDITARWGGLRPLIDICFAFDGDWPSSPLVGNPMVGLVRSWPSTRRPSPQWVARFYKAIIGIWFY